MAYGILKCDTVTFTDAGVDKSVSISGLVQNPTFSGNVTVTGTLSGVTVTGTTANFTSGNFTNISGGTHTITSGVFAAGSAASPSITFTGDLNTGIYSPGADQVAISTGGSGRLFVDASGSVGVGTSTLHGQFNVRAAAGVDTKLSISDGFATGNLRLTSSTETFSAYKNFEISSLNTLFYTGGSERLRITSAGLVGIGTSNPQAALEVGGAGQLFINQDQRVQWNIAGSATIRADIRGTSSNAIVFGNRVGGVLTDTMILDGSGRLGIGTTSPSSNLDVFGSTTSVVRIQGGSGGSDTNRRATLELLASGSKLYKLTASAADGSLQILDDDFGERARIDSSGRVGIGTSSPGWQFDCRGEGFFGTNSSNGIRFVPSAGIGGVNRIQSGVNNGAGPLQLGNWYGDGFVTIDSSGRVGIGTTSPSTSLHVQGGAGASAYATFGGNNNGSGDSFIIGQDTSGLTRLFQNSATPITFWTNAQERVRIDSAGRLLVGTSTARSNFFNATETCQFQVEGTTISDAVVIKNVDSTAGPNLILGKTRGSAIGSNTLVGNSDTLGSISFQGADGTQFVEGAYIRAVTDGTVGADDLPTRLVFSTTADGASSPTERLRITSAGNVGIGTTSPTSTLHIKGGTANPSAIVHLQPDNNTVSNYITFRSATDTTRGYIEYNYVNDYLAFATTNGSERLRITSAGLVGIGTSSPGRILDVRASNTEVRATCASSDYTAFLAAADSGVSCRIGAYAASEGFAGTTSNHPFLVQTNNTERLRITSAGLVGVNTSSPTTILQTVANEAFASSKINAVGGTYGAGSFLNAFTSAGGNDLGYAGFLASQLLNPTNRLYIGVHSPLGVNQSFVGTPDSNPLTFWTAAAERLRITSAGNVGIGTTNPGVALDVAGITRASLYFSANDNGYIRGDTAGELRIQPGTNGTVFRNASNSAEFARIDSSGRLLVGTSSARANFSGTDTPQFQVEGNSFNTSTISVVAAQSTGGGNIELGSTGGTTVGSTGTVTTNGYLGSIHFLGGNGTNLLKAAAIDCQVDGAVSGGGAADMPGRLVFSTTADGASSPTERMRINNIGDIGINNTGTLLAKVDIRQTSAKAALFVYKSDTGTEETISLRHDGATGATSRTQISFGRGTDGVIVGTISCNGSATAYNTSSDYRLKENVIAVSDGITRLQLLKPSRFNFIADPDTVVDGFIAHEVQAVVPEAITGEKDAVDDDGNPIYQGIDQSKLVPLLTAALQEAIGRIETLEQRLNNAGIN